MGWWGVCKIPLEDRINDFIKNKKVIDIKYSNWSNESEDEDSALVMYEEDND